MLLVNKHIYYLLSLTEYKQGPGLLDLSKMWKPDIVFTNAVEPIEVDAETAVVWV